MSIGGVLICTAEGRLCFYRNYGQLAHNLFEDFAFALAAAGKRAGRETFLPHGSHRLTYLPLDAFYIVLVTARSSNVIEDIAALGSLKEAVMTVLAGRVTEESVADSHAALAFAFDDMVSMGQRNVFSRAQVTALLEMESTNEKLQKAILLNKEKETRRRAQDEVRRQERDRKRGATADADDTLTASSFGQSAHRERSSSPVVSRAQPAATSRAKGLQLGGARPKQKTRVPSPEIAESAPAFDPLGEEIEAVVNEKVSGTVSSAGDWKGGELRGSFTLTTLNPRLERTAVKFHDLRIPAGATPRIPPNYDKQQWAEGVLVAREGSLAPASNTPVECLKYALKLPPGEASVPFKLATWFNERETSLEVEFNTEQPLFRGFDRFEMTIQLPERAGARVSDYAGSEVAMSKRGFSWVIAPLDSTNPSASVMITTKNALTPEELFPAEVRLESSRTAIEFSRLTFHAGEREPTARTKRLLTSQGLLVAD